MAKQSDPRSDPGFGQFAWIGLQVGVGVGLGALVGGWLDRRYGWSPWGMTLGAMIGLAGGLYLLIKEALRMNKD